MVSVDALVVFGLIAVALAFFVTETLPTDITAIGVLVSLVVLEPYTGVDTVAALQGFASPATITIVAMYVLSAGVEKTGLVDRLGLALGRLTGGDERQLLGATIGTTGLTAGFINNTPVVAVFIPMISGLAERAGVSPSKLLLPLSYAAMLGGTLTLVGTATNLLASDVARRRLGEPLSMFEFTPVGIIVFLVGAAYLLTVGYRLTPARIPVSGDLTETYDLEDHLSRLRVRAASPLVGQPVTEAFADAEADVTAVQLIRDDETASDNRTIEADDELVVRGTLQATNAVAERLDLRQLHRETVTSADLSASTEAIIAELVVPAEARARGKSVAELQLGDRYAATVLAVRRGSETFRSGLDEVTLSAGDTLFVRTTEAGLEHLEDAEGLLATDVDDAEPGTKPLKTPPLSPKTPIVVATLAAVVAVAALGYYPIVITALAGIVALVATGCLRPSEAYDAVSWNVVFLLAGVIPLGAALRNTGGDALVASAIVESATLLPLFAVVVVVYLLTGLLANLITPVASIVLLLPVAVDAAARIGASRYAFLLATMFAASTAFMTPVGYQTNLMVYGPGGYRFTDFLRVGAPLQLLLSVVTAAAIAVVFGLRPA
ncbi:SLC13 family permease [Natronomonas sp. CBA1123]|uniref:SLC13 family permease n=1 Tax=Natronomonas sp. CBA1123 TaxID=2668070 RepID=UPI0012EA05E7|nr:SLC13 family permease [Natronomonas sp. CBA1123]MUV86803.1 SLC13 family permease [Natronomonas sp. CBA1123]